MHITDLHPTTRRVLADCLSIVLGTDGTAQRAYEMGYTTGDVPFHTVIEELVSLQTLLRTTMLDGVEVVSFGLTSYPLYPFKREPQVSEKQPRKRYDHALTKHEHTHYYGVYPYITGRTGHITYRVFVPHNGKAHYVGCAKTADAAARLSDSYIRAHGLEKPLNFPEEASLVS